RLKLQGPDQVEPGATVRVRLKAAEPEGDPLTVGWVLQAETNAYGQGGDAEEAPPTYPDALLKADAAGAEVKMPAGGGGYRLFVFVRDGRGGAAAANVPLFVKGPVLQPKAKAAALPLVVYDEAGRDKPAYVPTGW